MDPAIRLRRNHQHLIASDVVIMATMLMRFEQRDCSENRFYHELVAWGLRLPERSRYHRRCKALTQVLKLIRAILLRRWQTATPYEIIDSAPIVLASERRSSQAKVMRGLAHKGFNATKGHYFYGSETTRSDGCPRLFPRLGSYRRQRGRSARGRRTLVSGTTSVCLGRWRGYLGQPLNDRLAATYGIYLWTPKRKNMKINPKINVA